MTQYTGTLTGWCLRGERVWGLMSDHTSRPDLNGHDCHTSRVLLIGTDETGNLIVKTASGSTYLLVDPVRVG